MLSRREWIALSAVPALAQTAVTDWLSDAVNRHDAAVEKLLKTQITDPNSRGRGIYADEYGLFNPGTGAGVIDTFLTAYLQPKSKYYKDGSLPERIRLAGTRRDKPHAVILDADDEPAVFLLDHDVGVRRLRVLGDIRQRLLDDAEHGRRLRVR